MLRIGIIIAAVALAASAQAEPGARLKPFVVANSDIVRIGDLVENAGTAAGIPVFRAPDLGTTGALSASRIAEALRPHDVKLDHNDVSEVVVTRPSRAISAQEITARIARALAGQAGLGEAKNLSITVDRDLGTIHVEPSATAELTVARMYFDARSGRFDVLLDLPGSTLARRAGMRFTGAVAETVETAVLARTIDRGGVLRAADVVVERRPKAEVAGEFIASSDRAVGLAARRALRAGQVLRSSDLMRPEVVQRNESVTIVYEVPGIVLTARGKALEAGSEGDVLSVLNIQSKRTVQATVTGPGRVTINTPAPGQSMILGAPHLALAQRSAQ